MDVENINVYTIGSGLDFPIKLSTPLDADGNPIQILNENGDMVNLVTVAPLVGNFDLIKQNIINTLNTPLGFSLRNEYFGCRITELIEEQNSQAIEFLLRDYIKDAIRTWEKRVVINKIITQYIKDTVIIKLRLNLINTLQEVEFELNYNTTNNNIYVNE